MLYYRYHEVRYTESKLMLVKSEFLVIKETPTGVWIYIDGGMNKRFVKNNARKRFACSTEKEALESFYARKKRQIKILKRQLQEAETALTLTPENIFAYSE